MISFRPWCAWKIWVSHQWNSLRRWECVVSGKNFLCRADGAKFWNLGWSFRKCENVRRGESRLIPKCHALYQTFCLVVGLRSTGMPPASYYFRLSIGSTVQTIDLLLQSKSGGSLLGFTSLEIVKMMLQKLNPVVSEWETNEILMKPFCQGVQRF